MKTLSTIDKYSKSRSPWKGTVDKESRLNFLAIQEESEFERKTIHEPRRKESKGCKDWFGVSTHNQEPFDHKSLRKFIDLLCEDIRCVQTEIIFVEQKEHDEELEKFNKAKEAFYIKLPELIVEHEGKYAAIIDDDIIIDEKEEAVFEKTTKEYGDITMYIGEIVDEKLELEITQKYVLE